MDILIAACGGAFMTGVFGLVNLLLQQRAAKKEKAEAAKEKTDDKSDAIKDALQLVLLDRVKYLGQSYIKKNEIELSDKQMLHKMHDTYKRLGGNGDLDWIMEEVDKLALNLKDD